MPSPTPPGQVLPPTADVVPIPGFISAQDTALKTDPSDKGPKKTKTITWPGGKTKKKIVLRALEAIYVLAYQRGWTDSAAHYGIQEVLEEGHET